MLNRILTTVTLLVLPLLFVAPSTQTVHAQPTVAVEDLAIDINFQGVIDEHFLRGRALFAADFDLDGRVDFYVGNPGDESYILRNVGRRGKPKFLDGDILLDGETAWGGAVGDYDNDGDIDIYVTTGANEGADFDFLLQNRMIEEGSARFNDVTDIAGVKGPVPDAIGEPVITASANAEFVDYDNDGDLDLWVNNNVWQGGTMDTPELALNQQSPLALNTPYNPGQNILYKNLLLETGEAKFEDVTVSLGFTTTQSTRHSTWFDFDNDGDLDLYENNYNSSNYLWRNRLMEDGAVSFEDVTLDFSPTGENLQYPIQSFVSCAADFNNDGWEDLIAFMRNDGPERDSPYPEGHAIFMNDMGTGFRNIGAASGINVDYVSGKNQGVMGSQVGDVNGDGVPDIYIGNGGPGTGFGDQFFVSNSPVGVDPVYDNMTSLIDYPSAEDPDLRVEYPRYPYRTHGTTFVDVDGDGHNEIAVNNGGPAFMDSTVQEPNRLFKFTGWSDQPIGFFRVRLRGDGININRDAIGARVSVLVGEGTSNSWRLHGTVRGSSCFSALSSFELYFGLGQASLVKELQVRWPDGTLTTITEGLAPNMAVEVNYNGTAQQVVRNAYDEGATGIELAPLDAGLSVGTEDATTPGTFALDDAYPNPFNPSAQIGYSLAEPVQVRLAVYDMLGREVALLVNEAQGAGSHTVTWAASNLPSGVYLYRLQAGTFSAAKTITLLK